MWVAYNGYGDLIAYASTRYSLVWQLEELGLSEYEVVIGVTTP
jgi:hypothetical protein